MALRQRRTGTRKRVAAKGKDAQRAGVPKKTPSSGRVERPRGRTRASRREWNVTPDQLKRAKKGNLEFCNKYGIHHEEGFPLFGDGRNRERPSDRRVVAFHRNRLALQELAKKYGLEIDVTHNYGRRHGVNPNIVWRISPRRKSRFLPKITVPLHEFRKLSKEEFLSYLFASVLATRLGLKKTTHRPVIQHLEGAGVDLLSDLMSSASSGDTRELRKGLLRGLGPQRLSKLPKDTLKELGVDEESLNMAIAKSNSPLIQQIVSGTRWEHLSDDSPLVMWLGLLDREHLRALNRLSTVPTEVTHKSPREVVLALRFLEESLRSHASEVPAGKTVVGLHSTLSKKASELVTGCNLGLEPDTVDNMVEQLAKSFSHKRTGSNK